MPKPAPNEQFRGPARSQIEFQAGLVPLHFFAGAFNIFAGAVPRVAGTQEHHGGNQCQQGKGGDDAVGFHGKSFQNGELEKSPSWQAVIF